ncbi:MAG: fumarylacetoacetate hydrolase family protein [Xanthomonadales bacterium]|nr:fumarylacetoacetate hydrolase family protein [Xanthomonadales bacterium]
MDFVIPSTPQASLAVAGDSRRFPVHRIYCIGRNYAEHAREMGAEPERGNPVFFLKPPDSVTDLPGVVAYPPGTSDLHHEVELVVALHGGGRDIEPADALSLVWGYGIGLDLTRRDLQGAAKARGLPWDTGKSFEQAAPCGPLHPVAQVGHPSAGAITLDVADTLRQRGDLADMLFPVAEVIAHLSRLFTLAPGDLLFTGTPAGVGPLQRGERFRAAIAGLGEVEGRMV